MKSLANYATQPVSIPLLADDIIEFHAARILLLIKLCGKSNRIDGLTKMAKLDFFVRYPRFFNIACEKLGLSVSTPSPHIESSMIRFRYGPWDNRYYHVLSYLEAKSLIEIVPKDNMYQLKLTEIGIDVAGKLFNVPSFSKIVDHMKEVKKILGSKTGSSLKKIIYSTFKDEIASLSIGKVIV